MEIPLTPSNLRAICSFMTPEGHIPVGAGERHLFRIDYVRAKSS